MNMAEYADIIARLKEGYDYFVDVAKELDITASRVSSAYHKAIRNGETILPPKRWVPPRSKEPFIIAYEPRKADPKVTDELLKRREIKKKTDNLQYRQEIKKTKNADLW